MNTPTTHGKNDHRFDDLLGDVRKIGADIGNGRLGRLRIGLLLVNGAYNNVVDTTRNKHGDGIDDAVAVTMECVKADTQADPNNDSKSAGVQASKFRACIKLGGWTRGGPGQPIDNVNKLLDRHAALKKSGAKVRDAFEALLKYASVQIKLQAAMDEKDLEQFVLKSTKEPPTLEEYLEGVSKKLTDLVTGKAANGTLQDTSPAVQLAVEGLQGHIENIRNTPDEDVNNPPAIEASPATEPTVHELTHLNASGDGAISYVEVDDADGAQEAEIDDDGVLQLVTAQA